MLRPLNVVRTAQGTLTPSTVTLSISLCRLPIERRASRLVADQVRTDTRMFSRRLKTGYFLLEGLNSFATVYYFYYLYFFLQKAYGFGNKANLMVAALNGGTYALAAWFSGRFAQRYGYFVALKIGFFIMILALSLGLAAHSASEHVGVMVLTVLGMSFTWPTLEALVSEGESRAGLQDMVGIYNLVWAGTAALANFSGGAMLQKFGFASLFYVPIAVNLSQVGLTIWLERKANPARKVGRASPASSERGTDAAVILAGRISSADHIPVRDVAISDSPTAAGSRTLEMSRGVPAKGWIASAENPNQIGTCASAPQGGTELSGCSGNSGPHEVAMPVAKRFTRMAWVANPFAYIGINTLIAVVPGVAQRLELSTMAAGFCCSTWCFARVGAFAVLWRWTGWHYRFRWLLLAYAGLVGAFGAVVLAPNLAVLVTAQLVFGASIGLIYYSSLFYSMDRSETKGEQGGIHEAAIGLGNCAGPAVGAAALQLVPQHGQSGTVAVIGLLLCGLGGLLRIWRAKSAGIQNEESRNLKILLVFLFCLLLGSPMTGDAATTTVIYQTSFESSQGYHTNADLVQQQGWVGLGSGGNGIVSGFFAGKGQQAYIGFTPPLAGDTNLFVFQPISKNLPQVQFSVTMAIIDSTTTNRDDFYWSVYNQQGRQLFTLDFDNNDLDLYYFLDNNRGRTWSGLNFTNGSAYLLKMSLDFTNNRWSATLGGALVATNQPITTLGAAPNFGDIDAAWIVYDANAPGDNFMVFDDYQITATLPQPQLRVLGMLNGSPTLRLTGQAGLYFALEASTNLLNWGVLNTNITTGGSFDYVDSAAAVQLRRFYRARWVP